MKRILVGAVLLGLILRICPGERSGLACLLAGFLSTLLLLQVGPRSIAEKVGILMTVSVLAWVCGPRASHGQSLIAHLFGWLTGGTALAFYLHPQSE